MYTIESYKRTLLRQAQRDAKRDGVKIPASMIYGQSVRLVFSPEHFRPVFAI